MAIFCIFSLFAGVLIYFLPETRDLPLPETMWDAVRMLNNTEQNRCVGGMRKNDEHEEHHEDEMDHYYVEKGQQEGRDKEEEDEGEDVYLYTNVSKR